MNQKSLIWKGEGIICTRKASNMMDSSSDFKNYSQEDILKLSRLDLFLIIVPVAYLQVILILETENIL